MALLWFVTQLLLQGPVIQRGILNRVYLGSFSPCQHWRMLQKRSLTLSRAKFNIKLTRHLAFSAFNWTFVHSGAGQVWDAFFLMLNSFFFFFFQLVKHHYLAKHLNVFGCSKRCERNPWNLSASPALIPACSWNKPRRPVSQERDDSRLGAFPPHLKCSTECKVSKVEARVQMKNEGSFFFYIL